jgi:hypothetical protein
MMMVGVVVKQQCARYAHIDDKHQYREISYQKVNETAHSGSVGLLSDEE